MSTYSTINSIPKMTSYTAPSGIVTASTESNKTSYPAWKAFDGSNTTGGWNSSTKIDWLAYEFSEPIIIGGYSINSGTVIAIYVPKTWTFEGWNGTSWDVLDTRTNEISWGYKETRYYEISNPSSYKKYRINITDTNGGTYIYLTELSMYQVLVSTKYLIKQNSQYYSIKDNTLALMGTPTDDAQKEQWFNDYGVDDLKSALLTPNLSGNKLIDSLDNQFEIRMMKAK